MFRLDNRRALVTGAGSGIGEATAFALASRGAMVYVADRDEPNGRRVADAIRATGAQASFVALDVTDAAACAAVAARVEGEGPLDVLVNNAGIGHVGTITTTNGEDLDRLYAVNVRGVFNVTKAFIGPMLDRRRGSIVNIASIGGIVGIRDRLAYCTTKFAVVGLTKSMALDHAQQGVRVNCVCPGRVETPFVSARLREYPDPEAAYREMASTQAIGRMGRPDEIAAAVVYLASDEAAMITGSALIIDGGWSAGK
ncbi:MAG: SDR family oxidoreductase [Acidobacteriota bacterium]|jgi:2-keto-3-deoxy-L-fuconate dehydrogenase|nr:MAG: short-chain dehydrogenase [Acidobacteriota bacterium]